MKKYQPIIIAVILASSLVPTGFAKNFPRSVEEARKTQEVEASGNISIHLKVYENGDLKENIAFQTVNGKTSFSVENIPEEEGKIQPRKFSGELTRIDDQKYLLSYNLSQSIAITVGDGDRKTIQYRDVGWKTEVELTKDEEVVLMKEADTLYTLLIGGSLNKSR